jgi:hypothetical protein
MLERLIKISSLSGAFLIFCGVLKLSIFYHHFGIDIVDYLTFSEIITSFLDDLNILFLFSLLLIVQSCVAFGYGINKTKVPIEIYFEHIMKFAYLHKIKYITFFFVFGLIIYFLTFFVGMRYIFIYLIAFCFIQLFSFLFMSKDDVGKIDIAPVATAIIIIICTIVSVILLSQRDVEVKSKNNSVVTIYQNSKVFSCSNANNLIYLGKTDNYTFIYQTVEEKAIILANSEIKEIEIQE